MKNNIIKLKNYLEEIFKKVVKWIDEKVSKYILNDNKIIYLIYIFYFIYILWLCFILSYDKMLLLLILLFLLYFMKFIKDIVFKMDKNERIMTFNLLFLIINILNIFFNILRFILQDIIIYFRKVIYKLIGFESLNEDLLITKFIDNIIPLISFQSCYILISIFMSFHILNYIFDFDKLDMEEKDLEQTWIRKYEKIYLFIFNFFIFITCLGIYLKFLIGLKTELFVFLDFLFFFTLIIIIVFNINGVYVICKYFLRK